MDAPLSRTLEVRSTDDERSILDIPISDFLREMFSGEDDANVGQPKSGGALAGPGTAPVGPPPSSSTAQNQPPAATQPGPALSGGGGGPGMPAQPGQAGPALADQPASVAVNQPGGMSFPGEASAGEEQEVNPQLSLDAANQSAEAAKTASTADKEAMNKELEGIVGGPERLQEAYEQALERIGGEEKFDPKLDKIDWGLFLMDFGMRMMANSGQYGAGMAAGMAGTDAMAGMMGRRTTEQENIAKRNEAKRDTAMTFAEEGVKMDTERSALGQDKKGVIWTDKGAYSLITGKYIKGPEGGVLQPGMEPGANNKATARTVSQEALIGAGLDPKVAARIAQGGAPEPAELQFEFGKQFDKMQESASVISNMPGTKTKWKDASFADRQAWIDRRVNSIYPANAQGSALTPYGRQGGSQTGRPSVMDKYK